MPLKSPFKGYIDFTSGIFAANLGHGAVAVNKALLTAILDYGLHTYQYPTDIREEYERRLCEWTGYEACALFSDGTVAVEAALRVMVKVDRGCTWWPFGLRGCFHGKTYGATCQISFMDEARPMGNWIIEGYRGWDAHFWSDALIAHLLKCQRGGYLICFDEIQSGFGRTGKKFAYEHYGIKPDLLVIGKGMGSGFPVSAVLGPANLLDKVDLTCTHGGNPLACAAGIATIAEFERLTLIEHSARKGHVLHKGLKGLDLGVQGRGMVAALLFESAAEARLIEARCQENGLLVVGTDKGSVKIGPPLTIPDEELVRGIEILGEVLGDG